VYNVVFSVQFCQLLPLIVLRGVLPQRHAPSTRRMTLIFLVVFWLTIHSTIIVIVVTCVKNTRRVSLCQLSDMCNVLRCFCASVEYAFYVNIHTYI